MKRRGMSVFLLAAALTLAASAAFGQGLAVKKAYTLTINVNVQGAQIYIDAKLINGNAILVVEGRHSIRVHADGYADFTQNVDVTSNMTVPVALRGVSYPLTIRVNVPGASVSVDGVDTAGRPIAVGAGQHTILVQADGFKDYNVVVNVTGPLAVPVSLEPAGFALSVNANVAGATVTINTTVVGSVPYTQTLAPGNYTVRVSADGFTDYLASVALDRPMNVVAELKARISTISLVIPAAALDPDQQGNSVQGQVKIFIDNRLANANKALDGIQVSPGRHRIRVTAGGLSYDLGDVMVTAGQRYVIQLSLAAQLSAGQ
jgi:hypothetical protein